MKLYLHAYSSLALLHSYSTADTRISLETLEDAAISIQSLATNIPPNGFMYRLTYPIHLLTSTKKQKSARKNDWVRLHTWPDLPVPNALIPINQNLYLSSPEFCYVQMAKKLTRIQLIKLGYELCARYRKDFLNTSIEECAPLSTKQRLSSFIEALPDSATKQIARTSLHWVAENSASPRETALSMIISLPYEMGGWGFDVPQLNYGVETARDGYPARRYIDLYWPARRFGLEYDSDAEHSSVEKLTNDSLREKEIELQDIRMERVTNNELKSASGRELLYQTLCKRLGKSPCSYNQQARFLQRYLAAQLLTSRSSYYGF